MVPSAFTSLDGLDRLRSVGGDLWVAENAVADLGGLTRLETIGESLVLWDLPMTAVTLPMTTLGDDLWLESLPELQQVSAPGLTSHGGSLWLQSLAQTSGSFTLEWRVAVGGRLALVDLPEGVVAGWSLPDRVGALTVSETDLSSLDGLGDRRVVQGELYIDDNPALIDVWGLDGREEVGGDMFVSQAGADWDAFSSLRSVGGWLRIAGSHTGVSGFGALEQVGEGLSLSGAVTIASNGYRLPTEAEWEYAARAGEDFKYSGSDDIYDVGWVVENAEEETHEVGGLHTTSWGTRDMSGNVAEWTNDRYDCCGGGYGDGGSEVDPVGSATATNRVVRGGSARDPKESALVASRVGVSSSKRLPEYGFRRCRSAD